MVNPDSNGAAIAVTYRAFVNALRTAGHQPGAVTTVIPVPPVEIAPLKPPVISTKPLTPADPPPPDTGGVTVQTGGLSAWLKSLFSKNAV
ncbi:hypothetical protein ACIQW5_29215 [Methylorubrum thiocyanatum]|uniref:hypothetical protein n=1 Tax=Methylorubrum thiocyanatum TaxID=47958 RepID=UPI00383ACCA3